MDTIELKASGKGSKLDLGTQEHPNRMPFKGVMTYFNRPSTEAPHGANGLRVYIPKEVGEKSLASLKGMAVNYQSGNPTGHNPRSKVGVITDAKLGETQADGAVPVEIEGYIYSLDFEEEATSIKASQSVLGFSYETAQTQLIKGEVNGEPVAIVTSVGYFTGCSILYRDSASYADTSLAASAEKTKEELTVDLEKLLEELKSAFKAEVNSLKEEFGHKAKEVVSEEAPKVEEAAKEAEKEVETKTEEVVKEVAPKVEEAVQQEVAKVEEAVAPAVEEAPKAEEQAPAQADATLNASSIVAELEAVKAELKAMKEQASLQASARKSAVYPSTPLAKFGLDEKEEKQQLMASIEKMNNLSVAQRLELKMAALATQK